MTHVPSPALPSVLPPCGVPSGADESPVAAAPVASIAPERLWLFPPIEQCRVEQRLRESEARYRHLFENAPIGYLTVGTDLRILDVNNCMSEMLGYPVEELVGARIHSLLPDTPAGRVRSEEVHRRHVAGDSVRGWELEMRRKDGRPLWINLWMEGGRDEGGAIRPARSIAVDVTDRVLAEAERARLHAQNLYLQEEIKENCDCEQIIGRSPALRAVLDQVGRVAPTDATVLLTGETGTGKELVARAIHSASKRRDRPLIKVNCAALPTGLVESELFGHEKGAFTGAVGRRPGRFELADGGTLFLDEVGELPAEVQAKLLRVLQEREFDPVGGTAPVRVDVRVVAATHRDLLRAVREKAFREDLYYRLHVFPLRLPPLRERTEDIPLLVRFLVNKIAVRAGKHLDGVTPATMRQLQEYHWPGNVRELENVLERAVILANSPTLDVAPDFLSGAAPPSRAEELTPSAGAGSVQPTPDRPLPKMEIVERDHITAVLQHTNWVIAGPHGAARILGLNASTLRSRIKKLDISRHPR